jgi:hypothetical protein
MTIPFEIRDAFHDICRFCLIDGTSFDDAHLDDCVNILYDHLVKTSVDLAKLKSQCNEKYETSIRLQTALINALERIDILEDIQ